MFKSKCLSLFVFAILLSVILSVTARASHESNEGWGSRSGERYGNNGYGNNGYGNNGYGNNGYGNERYYGGGGYPQRGYGQYGNNYNRYNQGYGYRDPLSNIVGAFLGKK